MLPEFGTEVTVRPVGSVLVAAIGIFTGRTPLVAYVRCDDRVTTWPLAAFLIEPR